MTAMRSAMIPATRPAMRGAFEDIPRLLFDFENRIPSGLTNTGANTNRWYFDADGVLTQVTSAAQIRGGTYEQNINTGLFESVGLLRENLLDHMLRNNTMVGAVDGTPGTVPTFWGVNPAGVTSSIANSGTIVDGAEVIDVGLVGTPTGSPQITMESNTGIPALTGETWTVSTCLAIVGGDLTNVGSIRLEQRERDVGGASVITNSGPDIKGLLGSSLARIPYTVTLSGGINTAFVNPDILVTPSGGPINLTLRIGVPQEEENPYATSIVKTAGAAVVRNAEKITFANTLPPYGRWEANYRPKTDGTNLPSVGYILNGIDGGLNAWAWRMQDTGVDIQPRGIVGNGAVVAEAFAIAQTQDVDNLATFNFGPDSAQMIVDGTRGAATATGYAVGGGFPSYEILAFVDGTVKTLASFDAVK